MNGFTHLSAALLLSLAGHAAASQPEGDPALNDQSLKQISEELRSAGAKPVGISPTRSAGASPIRAHADLGLPPSEGRLLPEGSFIVQLEGIVHIATPGAWIFEPVDLIDESKIKPLIMLPSQTLTRLIQIVGPDAADKRVSLTGEVTLYRDRNYLLVSAITVTTPEATSTEPETAPIEPETVPLDDPISQNVQDLIRDLEKARYADRAILQPMTANAGGGRAPVPEGRTFMRRRARLTYLTAGEIALAFDNDPDQVIDVPLVVLPCNLLERIEWIVENHGDSLPVSVSGQSYAFNGRSFIMPHSIVIERPTELDTRQ